MTAKPRKPAPDDDWVDCDYCGSNEHGSEDHPVTTAIPFNITVGKNLPNHSVSARGRADFVRVNGNSGYLDFRTKQEVYRVAAKLLDHTETLPDEEPPDSFESIQLALIQEKEGA